MIKYYPNMINIRCVHLYAADLANVPAYYQSRIWLAGSKKEKDEKLPKATIYNQNTGSKKR